MLGMRARHHYQRTWWLLLGIILVIFSVTVVWFVHRDTSAPIHLGDTTKTSPKVSQPRSISSNVLFSGNTFWGRYIEDWSMASPLQYKYPFSRLSEFHRDQYDAWISGLECPTVADVHMTSAEQEVALRFNCSPKFLPEAAKWFTAFTLANNHTDNQGADGFSETKQQLEKNHIQYFGHYDPRVLDDICEVISLPVTVSNDDDTKTKGELPVVMCGYHGVFRIPSPESVAEMQKYSAYMPVIAMPHMGVEYEPAPDQLKTDFYRSLIDAGADMVIGDHPHWVQNTESYKGHLIVYSMGNFMFDQQGSTELTRSAAIRMVMDVKGQTTALLHDWLELGKTCAVFKDECLQKAQAEHLKKLPATYRFNALGTNDSDKIVKPATTAQNSLILQRLQWRTTMNQLRAPYGSL